MMTLQLSLPVVGSSPHADVPDSALVKPAPKQTFLAPSIGVSSAGSMNWPKRKLTPTLMWHDPVSPKGASPDSPKTCRGAVLLPHPLALLAVACALGARVAAVAAVPGDLPSETRDCDGLRLRPETAGSRPFGQFALHMTLVAKQRKQPSNQATKQPSNHASNPPRKGSYL